MTSYKIINNEISDGYHTFSELYDHRIALYCYCIRTGALVPDYAVLEHYEGWDLVACHTQAGEQVSYHIHISQRELWSENFPIIKYDRDRWDSHSAKDVVKRLNRISPL